MTQVASGSSLHSAPPNACRAPPHDSTPTASFDVCLLDLLWPQPPLSCSSHQSSTPGPLIPVVAACVKDARPSRWLAPLERPRWPPPPSGWTRHQPRCFRHERVGWRGSAGDVWLLLGARTWRTGRCSHLLCAAVRTCCHHLPNSAFPKKKIYELHSKCSSRGSRGGYPLAALGSEDWRDAIHVGVFSDGRPSS